MISLDRVNVSLQVTKLKIAEDKCDDAINKIRRALTEAENSWKGSAGDAARTILEDMIRKMETNKVNISSMAATIKKVADEINKRDEEAAARINSTRK